MRSAWARITAFADTRAATVACFAGALAVYGVESVAWPLEPGRDATSYLAYYVDMWHAHPAYPFLMLFRTPVAPLVFGALLQLGGPLLAEVAMAFAYAASILAFARVARSFGGGTAVVTVVALLAIPAYGALFHQVSSDPIFALALALWTLALTRAVETARAGRFVVAGAAFVLMVLARPSAQALLVSVVVPLFVAGPWRRRLVLAGSYLCTVVVLLLAWSSYNDLRYGSFTVARGLWAGTPFYRTFVIEKIVQPENGPASRRLAQAVRTKLLTKQPYAGNHVTTAQYFSTSDDHMWEDAVVLSDRVWGWNDNYAILRRVALEAIDRHPGLYAHDVASSMWAELKSPYRWSAPVAARAAPARTLAATPAAVADLAANTWWLASTPSGRPPVPTRVARQAREVARLRKDLPDRSGSTAVAAALNGISRVSSSMILWIVLALAGLAVRRSRTALPLLALSLGAALALLATLVGYGPTPEYQLPFDPVYVLFGVGAVLAPRARAENTTGSASASATSP